LGVDGAPPPTGGDALGLEARRTTLR
jgi:hypothetical protein